MTAKKKRGFLSRLLGNFGDPIIRVLLAAVAVEVAFTFRQCNWYEVGGIVLAVLVSSFVSTASEYGSERAFERLSREAGEAAEEIVGNCFGAESDRDLWAWYCRHFDRRRILDRAYFYASCQRQGEVRDAVTAFQAWLRKEFPKGGAA